MPNWTDAQRAAIEAGGGDVLVSAAAGSGKTTAMTERIIRKAANGGDIGRMLVVTFTRASAADMKKKISSSLRERAEGSPDDRELAAQLTRLGSAEIGTIHSFCGRLLRQRFAECGISPDARVAEEAEASLIKAECMEDTLDALYEKDDADGAARDPAVSIAALADQLEGKDDGRMGKTLLSLYDKTSCLPRGYETIADSAEALEAAGVRGFLDSPFGKYIKKSVCDGIAYYAELMRAGLEYIAPLPDFCDIYSAAFETSLSGLTRIKSALDAGDYDGVKAALDAYDPEAFGRAKSKRPDKLEFLFGKKTEAKNFVKGVRKGYFGVTDDELRHSIERTAGVCRGIVRVLGEFDRRLAAEKRRRGLLDYGDLERMTYKLLSDKNTADAVAREYDEIYIDEYQDVNGIQDAIFSAISRGNRFMVGDVKQSIYGFRGSDPKLFDAYRRRMDTIYMSENFRCDEPIVKFTNAVCCTLMKHGNVSCTENDALKHGKDDGEPPHPVEVILTEKGEEEEAVADIAERLIAGGTAPSDIAILMRSAKEHAKAIADALERRGIGCINDTKENFFESPEILFILCLLHVCDNPLYDIYTAGALRSPAFGFTLDELTRLKSGDKRPLFRVLRDAAEGKLSHIADDAELTSKCRDAYLTICRWRESARMMTADEALAMLYGETGVEAILWAERGAENEEKRSAAENLDALYDYARAYESGGFRGLHRFVDYIDSIVEEGVKNPVAVGGGAGLVNIMTVHGSKGLEFPVVILAGCGRGRNEKDARGGVLFTSDTGAAMKLRTEAQDSTVKADTLPRVGVAEAMLFEGMSEEMRILYVALTRAKERLFVTAAVGDPDRFVSNAEHEAEFFSPYSAMSEKTYIGWILTSLRAAERDAGAEGDFYTLEIRNADAAKADEIVGEADAAADKAASLGGGGIEESDLADTDDSDVAPEDVARYREIIRERLSYRYPYEKLGALPAKLSVSRLEPDILDRDDDSFDLSGGAAELVAMRQQTAPGESALAGTATHIYMQFCDFAKAEADVRAEGERLLSLGFITKEDLDRIRFDEIEKFFRSGIYGRIKAAREVWRERRFNVRLPASDFTENEDDRELYRGEELLVQGVIDCFFREADGGIVLLDYKTDRLSPYELSHPRAAEETLRARHSRQLSYYKAALTSIFGTAPKETYVYAMQLGREVGTE